MLLRFPINVSGGNEIDTMVYREAHTRAKIVDENSIYDLPLEISLSASLIILPGFLTKTLWSSTIRILLKKFSNQCVESRMGIAP